MDRGVAYGLWLIPVARLFMPTVTRTVEHIVPATTPSFELEASQSLSMAHLAAAPALIGQFGGWSTLLLVVWLGVAAVLFGSRLIAFERDRRAILKSSVRSTRLGSVRLVRSPEIPSPVALEILRPIIALPCDFERIYKKRERRLVLERELAHHRSGDLVVNFFAFVLLCLQWFNPLAWVAHAAFRFDQEAACDARYWTRRRLPTARATAARSQKPLRGGRCSSRARSIVHPVCKGGFNPCFVVQVRADASPADCSSLPRPLRRFR